MKLKYKILLSLAVTAGIYVVSFKDYSKCLEKSDALYNCNDLMIFPDLNLSSVAQVLEGVKKSDLELERILTKGDFGAEIKQFKDNKLKALGASKRKTKKM